MKPKADEHVVVPAGDDWASCVVAPLHLAAEGLWVALSVAAWADVGGGQVRGRLVTRGGLSPKVGDQGPLRPIWRDGFLCLEGALPAAAELRGARVELELSTEASD